MGYYFRELFDSLGEINFSNLFANLFDFSDDPSDEAFSSSGTEPTDSIEFLILRPGFWSSSLSISKPELSNNKTFSAVVRFKSEKRFNSTLVGETLVSKATPDFRMSSKDWFVNFLRPKLLSELALILCSGELSGVWRRGRKLILLISSLKFLLNAIVRDSKK